MISFGVHPIAFANVISNVLTMSLMSDAPEPLIYLRYQWDDMEQEGQIMAIGIGRISAGIDWVKTEGGTRNGYAEVHLLGKNPNKTDVVDDLKKLQTALRKTSSARDAVVTVQMENCHSMTVTYNDELVGELGDLWDYRTHSHVYDGIEDMVDLMEECEAPTMPTSLDVSLLSKLNDIKVMGKPSSWGVADLAKHPEQDILGVAMGPTFRGLIGTIVREGFKEDNPGYTIGDRDGLRQSGGNPEDDDEAA